MTASRAATLLLLLLLAIAVAPAVAQETGGSFGGGDFGTGGTGTGGTSGGGGGSGGASAEPRDPFEHAKRLQQAERERRERQRELGLERSRPPVPRDTPPESRGRSVPLLQNPWCILPGCFLVIALPVIGIIAGLRRSPIRDD